MYLKERDCRSMVVEKQSMKRSHFYKGKLVNPLKLDLSNYKKSQQCKQVKGDNNE